MYVEGVNARRFLAAVAAPALFLLLLGAGPAGAAPKERAAHAPHKIVKHATPTYTSGYAPSQLAAAYGVASLDCGTTCGAGQTIAIVDANDAPTIEADLAAFDAQFGLPCDNCFQKLTPQGQPPADAGWALEATLDVEWAHAIAPGARILLVEAASASFANLLAAVDSAVAAGANVVSMSWGSSGEFLGETIFDSHFTAKNVTFVASSGDSGPGVVYPAASPYVTAVGGTHLTLDAAGALTGPETAWSGSGGGVSAYEAAPAYQTSLGLSGRAVPDVAYDGDPSTGVAVYDTTPYTGESGWFVVGGTSAGAPQWAALAAIANSRRATPLGNMNAALYGLPSSAFRDITSPSPAAAGYDTATGRGSPLADVLVPLLAPTLAGTLSFASSTQTAAAGSDTGPITVQLSSPAPADVSVAFASSSATGGFATAPGGAHSATLAVTVPAGSTSAPGVYYRDTKAGSPTVTVSASGYGGATQSENVTAAALATLSVTPATATVALGATQLYRAAGTDAYGNAVAVNPTWSVSDAVGTFAPNPGNPSTFTAAATGTGTVTATAGLVTATASVAVVTTPTVRVASVTYTSSPFFGILQVTVSLVNGSGSPVAGANVAVTLNRNGVPYATGTATTGSNGKATITALFTPAGCYTSTVTKVTVSGYTWNGVTPPNQVCK